MCKWGPTRKWCKYSDGWEGQATLILILIGSGQMNGQNISPIWRKNSKIGHSNRWGCSKMVENNFCIDALFWFQNPWMHKWMRREGRNAWNWPKDIFKGVWPGILWNSFIAIWIWTNFWPDWTKRNSHISPLFAHNLASIYAPDELFFQALAFSDDLNAPGGFTRKCIDQRMEVPSVTRWKMKLRKYSF